MRYQNEEPCKKGEKREEGTLNHEVRDRTRGLEFYYDAIALCNLTRYHVADTDYPGPGQQLIIPVGKTEIPATVMTDNA